MCCQKCGNKIESGSIFCTMCGNKVDVNNINTMPNNTDTQLSKKELKRIEKEEKKKVIKAREIIGTDYLITLIVINIIPSLIFENYLAENILVRNILMIVWYSVLPFVGAYMVKKMHFNKLKSYATNENYKKIRTWSIIDLSILGLLYVGINNISILLVPIILGYVFSVIYLINEMDKAVKGI